MNRLLILGAGGHGRVVADLALAAGWSSVAFLDDADGCGTLGLPLLGGFDRHAALREAHDGAVCALGNNTHRVAWVARLRQAGWSLPALIHPSACVSRFASIGAGTVICAQAVVGPGAALGDGVIVNHGATADHDCRIADGVHLSPGAHVAGGVTVGHNTWIGIGASVREGVTIGAEVIVGAGAAVVRDLPDGVRALGVPARIIRGSEC